MKDIYGIDVSADLVK